MKAKIANIIMSLAEYYDKVLAQSQLEMYVDDLSGLSEAQLEIAVKKYRRDPANVFFPLPAKLVELVACEDGRPGAEEAWSVIPKDEDASVVWTEEMRQAYSVAHQLLKHDPIAARMAFKEKYNSLLKESRALGKPARWSASFGTEKSGREAVIRIAVEKNQLSVATAQKLLPELRFKNTDTLAIEHNPQNGEDYEEIKSLIVGSFKGMGDA